MVDRAIILLSGGLDCTVALAWALNKRQNCFCLSFDYAQKHNIELEAAKKVCAYYGLKQQVIHIDPHCFAGSSLVERELEVPKGRSENDIISSGIQSTYVPARNTLFMSYAMGYAEILNAKAIYVGFNKMDRGGYPDCLPAFVEAFQSVINVATKQSVESTPPTIISPLLDLDKREIVALGIDLGAPLELTHSCYSPTSVGLPCSLCDACRLRDDAFAHARKTMS
ncbi:MAG: 7-cyano-7-deazaguanine synthase QueC [Chlamydiota bacterium]